MLVLTFVCYFLIATVLAEFRDTVVPAGLQQTYKGFPPLRPTLVSGSAKWTSADLPAENYCPSMSGHLVNIIDRAENDFVHQIRKKNDIWIGLNKLRTTRHRFTEWSDGQSADYINWDSTQPNEPKVDCVYMAYSQEQPGTWFDYGCWEHRQQYFVCKLPTP
ncbi:unnamed protein product, partial [Mesorhabditis spiculigera]